jgi:hypothetical protein
MYGLNKADHFRKLKGFLNLLGIEERHSSKRILSELVDQDFVQILYFAGGMHIINENIYYCQIFSSSPSTGESCGQVW